MEDGSWFLICLNLTKDEWISINLTYSVNGAVCFVISSVIVLLLLISRSYHTLLQRLFLYLMVVTAVRQLTNAISIEHQLNYSQQEMVCTWIGYFNNWTGIMYFVFTVSIMSYLFFQVLYLAKGNTSPRFLKSKRQRAMLEGSFVVLSSVITFVYDSIPHFTHNYGLAGGWCWIKTLNENCTTSSSGLLEELFTGFIFDVSGGIIGAILMIAMAVVYCRLPDTLQEARKLLKRTSAVIACFLLYVLLYYMLYLFVWTLQRQISIWIFPFGFHLQFCTQVLLFSFQFDS